MTRELTVETLHARYDRLQADTSYEECSRLSQDVLAALVDHQGLVIALQRRALESHKTHRDERAMLRARAEAAFATVQRLHQLRRKVHTVMAEKRTLAARDTRYIASMYAHAS